MTSLNHFANGKFLDWSIFKVFADDKINMTEKKNEISSKKERKLGGERRKFMLPASSPFLTMFSKGLFYRVAESPDCVVED